MRLSASDGDAGLGSLWSGLDIDGQSDCQDGEPGNGELHRERNNK